MEHKSLLPVSASDVEAMEKALKVFQSAVDTEAEYLATRGWTRATVDMFRLGVVTDMAGYENYRGCLAIPYLVQGKPVQMRFRTLHGDGPKYLTMPGDPVRIFNVDATVRASDAICIAEGEGDAMTLTQAGFHAVGIPGALNWKRHWRELFRGIQKVYIWGDPDDAGRTFAQNIRQQLGRGMIVPIAGGDVNDVYTAAGGGISGRLVLEDFMAKAY